MNFTEVIYIQFCLNLGCNRLVYVCWLIAARKWLSEYWFIIWAPSSEFVSSSIPSWQILTAHAQPFRGARDLAFCLKVPLDSLLVWASSEGSGETARMGRLAWTFAARIGYKYQISCTNISWLTKEAWTKLVATQLIWQGHQKRMLNIIL